MRKVLIGSAVLLTLSSAPAFADLCTEPGDLILGDAAGDVALLDPASIPLPSPVGDFFDLLTLSLSTPPAASIAEQKIVFTIEAAAGAPGLPPGSGYFSSFNDPRKTTRGVRAEADQMGGFTYYSYVVGASQGGMMDGRFVEDGTQVPAEGSISGGIVTITVNAKDIGVRDYGDTLSGFNAGSVLAATTPAGVGAADVPDKIPDDLEARGTAPPVTVDKCKTKSASARAAEIGTVGATALSSKAGTNFGGAFGLLNLLVLLPLALRRRLS